MVGSKPSASGNLPKDQKCHFLIGPVSSWFMANISDLWTEPPDIIGTDDETQELQCPSNEELLPNKLVICCDQEEDELIRKSYYAYGSIGCFCYGLIEKSHKTKISSRDAERDLIETSTRNCSISGSMNNLVDIKEDNSKVICLRFNKTSSQPYVMILTENGTLLIHDCNNKENMIHFKKNELINKVVEQHNNDEVESYDTNQLKEHQPIRSKKKAKMVVYQQINSFVWPLMKHAFLGISLLKEKKSLLVWLRMKNLIYSRQANGHQTITKTDLIESYEILNLDLDLNTNPICSMESSNPSQESSIIVVAMDDGLIIVVNIHFSRGQSDRIIKLSRHNDQICSMSLFTGDTQRYPMGLLASVSRDGLVLIWDIDNELYFADYQGGSQDSRNGGKHENRINWFALSFVRLDDGRKISLAVSNISSGITILNIPEKVRTKVRLMELSAKSNKKKNRQTQKIYDGAPSISHHALIFNLIFDPLSQMLATCSLDGNHIIWSCNQEQPDQNTNNKAIQLKNTGIKLNPEYLIPAMHNNARTHMIRFNLIREELLGLALGKAGIRFYSVHKKSQDRQFNMTTSHNIIARQITKCSITPTSIAWNPAHEYRIAIGTIDGRVLRADLMPRKPILIEAIREELGDKHLKKSSVFTETDDHLDDLFGIVYQPLDRNEETTTKTSGAVDPIIHNQNNNLTRKKFTPDDASLYNEEVKTDAIYSLCWGPNPIYPNDLTRLAIYAVGTTSHRLFIYHSKKENSEKITDYLLEYEEENPQLSSSLPEARNCASNVSWKLTMDVMALGTTSGKIIIVNYDSSAKYFIDSQSDQEINVNNQIIPSGIDRNNYSKKSGIPSITFKRLAVIEGGLLGSSYIHCLAWHPSADKDDIHYYYLAASSNESPVLVYDLKDNDKHNENCKYSLAAHKKPISDIAWNPHQPDQLATSSFDRNCFAWSLKDNEPIIMSKFMARDRLFTVEWSSVDEDLILTSGHDSTIWAWRPSQNLQKFSGDEK